MRGEAWRRIQGKNWSGARFFARVAVASDPSWPDGHRMLGYAIAEHRISLRHGPRFSEATTNSPLPRHVTDERSPAGRTTSTHFGNSREHLKDRPIWRRLSSSSYAHGSLRLRT